MMLHVSRLLVDGQFGLTFERDGEVSRHREPPDNAWTIGVPSAALRVEDLALISGIELNLSPPHQFL